MEIYILADARCMYCIMLTVCLLGYEGGREGGKRWEGGKRVGGRGEWRRE